MIKKSRFMGYDYFMKYLFLLFILLTNIAVAEDIAEVIHVGKFKDWQAKIWEEGCYSITQNKKGTAMMVSRFNNIKDPEISIVFKDKIKPNSSIKVYSVGKHRSFDFFSIENRAWLSDNENNDLILSTMMSGEVMFIEFTNYKNKKLKERISLNGLRDSFRECHPELDPFHKPSEYFADTNITSDTDIPVQSDSETKITKVKKIPENKIDNKAPVLEIEDRITVTERNYTISGTVSDESDVFVEADGISIPVKNNKFTINGSSAIGITKYKIIAFDKWGNETKKDIIVERIIQTAQDTSLFEQLNPDKLRVKSNKDRIALVIGIEEYENISDANFAKRDAEFFIDYVQGAFGVPQQNIKYFFNSDAERKSKFQIKEWLKKNIRDNTEIYLYFAGHGLAQEDGNQLYLLTHDTIVEYIEDTAINRNEIFNDIAQYNPKRVIAFLDTCYSGAGRADGQMLLAMRGLVVVDEQKQRLPDNFTLFTAASAQESAWSLPEAQHGTFSYFLMKGMEGNADLNGDKKLTNGELRDYLLDNVGRYAQQQQTPQLVGDPNQVLIKF